MQIFLHDDVAAAGEGGVLVADISGVDGRLPGRILRAVDEAEQIAVVEIAKAMHLVDRRDRARPAAIMICVASSKQRSMRLARMWKSRSPGVATAWRAPALISRNGCSSAGRGWPKSLSQASDPIPITQERLPSMSRKPTARSSPGRSPQNDRTAGGSRRPG